MIQTTGKRDPEKEAQILRQLQRKEALAKRPKKNIDKLTPTEREAAIDAMLEWWLRVEE